MYGQTSGMLARVRGQKNVKKDEVLRFIDYSLYRSARLLRVGSSGYESTEFLPKACARFSLLGWQNWTHNRQLS